MIDYSITFYPHGCRASSIEIQRVFGSEDFEQMSEQSCGHAYSLFRETAVYRHQKHFSIVGYADSGTRMGRGVVGVIDHDPMHTSRHQKRAAAHYVPVRKLRSALVAADIIDSGDVVVDREYAVMHEYVHTLILSRLYYFSVDLNICVGEI